ncbi:MAG: hypothetical protein QF531_06365, partial [Candidatus Poseidonia sp.]|nr:hypothetical protein [Poseidonia sp.]
MSQLNIAFQPAVIGATSALIDATMEGTKAAFVTGMLAKDLESLQPGAASASAMSSTYANTVAAVTAGGGTEAMASAGIGNEFFHNTTTGFNVYFAAMNLSEMNNATGQGEMLSYTDVGGATPSFTDLTYAFNGAVMPGSGADVSLLSDVGTMVFAGHCDAYPTDLTNATIRAKIWGYEVEDNATTIANDYAMCYGIGGNFASNFGGGDADWMLDTTGTAVNAATRLSYMGITMDNTAAMGMLFGAPGDDDITGLLEISDDKTDNGAAKFLGYMAAGNMTAAMDTTGIQDPTTLGQVAAWVTGWFNDSSSLPMVLLGGSGDMTGSLFVNTTFGAEDPLNGGYLSTSLNIGQDDGSSLWELLGRDAIDLNPALSGHILYNESTGLTTQGGAVLFLYGELSGQTPPIFNGNSLPWNETTISTMYGVDENVASAMRLLMMGDPAKAGIYGTTADAKVPGYLMSIGAMPYLTQSFNNWLLGWQDAATGGWLSLETNETYYGSGGVANGDGTNYTM